ncbi:MAG: hypothetical protein JRE23_02730 [Deltaproteobacteria bacterium]|nr:hypothetical protein [Deltaproteobacteria bacterium]
MSDNGIILWGPLGVAKAYYETLKEEQKQSFKIMEFEEKERKNPVSILKNVNDKEHVNLLQSMQKLSINENDIIVLRSPLRLSKDAREGSVKMVKEFVKGLGHKPNVLFLHEGMEIGVLEKGK